MSQHKYKTCLEKQEVTVLMGWDRPLQYFYLVIDANDSDPVWSNLDLRNPYQNDLTLYKKVLNQHGITVPEQMFSEILQDKELDVGNKTVTHSIINGEYRREQVNE